MYRDYVTIKRLLTHVSYSRFFYVRNKNKEQLLSHIWISALRCHLSLNIGSSNFSAFLFVCLVIRKF